MDLALERAVRNAAFDHLRSVADETGIIAWSDLHTFVFEGEQIHLVGTGNGIFKPRQLDLPISILTAAPKSSGEQPYPDTINEDNFLHYRYRGTDPQFHENVRLRRLLDVGLPIIYLHGIERGRYLVSAAVLMDDRPQDLTFLGALIELASVTPSLDAINLADVQRGQQLRLVQDRVNQASFRARVLKAYRSCCALCRIRHSELLDAAHIIPHADGGRAIIPNGLSLCKIHHAAYDSDLLGIRPDLIVEIRADVLDESDGPMLAHGLQALHGTALLSPRTKENAPDARGLEFRYERFRLAS